MSISEKLGDEQELVLSAGRIRYRERGEGPPVLFVHGLIVNGDLWRNVVPRVAAAGFRCVTPDWPLGSHTYPMRRTAELAPPDVVRLIAEFVEELGLDRPTVVGNDTGTGLAQMLAVHHPDAVGGLVLTAGDAFANFPPHLFKPLIGLGFSPSAMRVAVQGFRVRPVARATFWPLTKRLDDPRIYDSYLKPLYDNPSIADDLSRFLRGMRPWQLRNASRALGELDLPAGVIWTEGDAIFPRAHGERLAELLRCDLHVVEDSHGFIPEDQPAACARLLKGCLRARTPALR